MTTKFPDNALSKLYCRGVSHEKQHFGRFSSLPPTAPSSSKLQIKFFLASRRL